VSDTDPSPRVSLGEIFRTFLLIGATSFGGGVVAYLHASLVDGRHWLDDEDFMSALEISQTLPGLNATNMSIIVGDRLRGVAGALAGFAGMVLPGSILLFVLGALYGQHGQKPLVAAALDGVAAAATGLLLATTLQIGRKQLTQAVDLALVTATCVAISVLHVSLGVTLLTIGPVAIWWYRPRPLPAPEVVRIPAEP
jgi:chromate transporter